MTRRKLRAGDHIWIAVPSASEPQRLDTQLVARDEEQLLVLCHASDLEGLGLDADQRVQASWHRDGVLSAEQMRITHMASYPVGTLVLAADSRTYRIERRAPRLHRVLPAQLWTPETGHLAATVVDISVGGARLRLRQRPPAIECDVVLGLGDEPVEVHASIVEIVPPGVAGRDQEVRLQFQDPDSRVQSQISEVVRRGVTDAIDELRHDARAV